VLLVDGGRVIVGPEPAPTIAPMEAAALAAGAVVLLIITVTTARRPPGQVPDLAGYYDAWATLHGGYDPRGSVWVRGWLRLVYAMCRPLARAGVAPDALTLWSLWTAAAVYAVAAYGGRWALAGGLLTVGAGLADNLDGGVAAMTGRATRWGYVLDSFADRLADVVIVAAVVAVGAPAELAAGCVVAFLLLEYVRARAANAGAGEVGAVTVGERPNRIIFCAAALLAAGVVPARAGGLATAGLAVLTALSVAGLLQLLVTVRRQLR
jgi:CDP-diacylglycerol---glycerol-3-phosphate 3-phosphatidyltransferase